jgi:heme-degrading monooxygenase HmoA
VIHELRGLPGFRGAHLLTRHGVETMAVTLFDSLDTVKAFAGTDHTRERVTPPARATLLDSDPHVLHFGVLVHPLVR